MPFVRADTQHPFEARLRGVPDGTPVAFKIMAFPRSETQCLPPETLVEGDVPAAGGCVRRRWQTQGPDVEGAYRAWRVAYEVTATVNGRELRARSHEIDVYHDWVEVTAVDEAGAVLPNARFDLRVVNGTRPACRPRRNQSTGSSGTLRVAGLPAGDVGVDWKPPFRLVQWEQGTGCKLKAKVKVIKAARFVWPAVNPGTCGNHKQYVNVDPNPSHKEWGRKIKVKVGLDDGKAGDKLYVKVTYQASAQSPRNDITRPLITGGSCTAWADQGGKELTLARDGEQPEVEIDLGIAGMDTVSVHVGPTNDLWDAELGIVNFRRVDLEMLQPTTSGANQATTHTVFNADGTAGLPASYLRKLNDQFGRAGIEVFVARAATYDKTTIPAHLVQPGAWFQVTGAAACVLTDDVRSTLRDNSTQYNMGKKRQVSTIWCDFLGGRETFTRVLDVTAADAEYDLGSAGWTAAFVKDPYDQAGTRSGIERVRWRTTEYQDATGAWRPITANGDPGGSKRTWQTVAEASHAQYVELKHYRRARITLPTAAAGDAGNFLSHQPPTPQGGTAPAPVPLKLQVEVVFRGAAFDALGAGWHGYLYMSSQAGVFTEVGITQVLLHEIGHNLGLAYFDKAVDATYGRNAANHIPGVAAPAGVPTGIAYAGHDHTGPHCAAGVTDLTAASFAVEPAQSEATCIMFGSTDMNAAAGRVFDDQCITHLKATDCSDVHKAWEA